MVAAASTINGMSTAHHHCKLARYQKHIPAMTRVLTIHCSSEGLLRLLSMARLQWSESSIWDGHPSTSQSSGLLVQNQFRLPNSWVHENPKSSPASRAVNPSALKPRHRQNPSNIGDPMPNCFHCHLIWNMTSCHYMPISCQIHLTVSENPNF